MKARRLLTALSLFIIFSCGNREVSKKLSDVEGFIQAYPDSALSVLRGISQDDLRSREEKAKFSLLYSMALDKNYIDTTDLSVIQPAVDYYKHHGTPDEKLKAYLYQAKVYKNRNEYDKAIVAYTKASQYGDKAKDKRSLAIVYQGISISHSMTFNDAESRKYNKLAYETFESIGYRDGMNRTKYIEAVEHFNLGEREESDSLYRLLLKDPYTSEDLRFLIMGNLAYQEATKDRYASADSLFDAVLRHDGSLQEQSHWAAYAYCLEKEGRNSESDKVFSALEEFDPKSMVYNYWRGRSDMDGGRYKESAEHFLKANASRDSVIFDALQKSTVKVQRDIYDAQNQNNISRARIFKLSCIIAILLLLFCIAIFVTLYKRKSLKAEEERKRLLEISESVKRQMVEMTNIHEKERKELRAEYVKMYKRQFQIFDEISDIVVKADKNKNQQKKYEEVYEKVKGIAYDIDSDKDGQKKFEGEINKRMDNVMKDFRKDFPDLSEQDYRFVSFQFVGFNANLIATLSEYPSASAMYMRKHRLRERIKESSAARKDFYLELLG